MSDVNVEDIDMAISYYDDKHTRCCCGYLPSQAACSKCRPTMQICCLEGIRSDGNQYIMRRCFRAGTRCPGHWLVGEYVFLWDLGEPCDVKEIEQPCWYPTFGYTNLCGEVCATTISCDGSYYRLTWGVTGDCKTVEFILRGSRTSVGDFLGASSITVDRDWNTGTGSITFTDPIWVYWNNLGHPAYQQSTPRTITFSNCPVPTIQSTDCNPDPPPDCDPGCWPECVGCPTQRDLAIVVDQSPTCCLSGVFPLTYNSGSNTYTLASPVGGPVGTCGRIMSATVSCSSSTSISLSLTISDVGGSTTGGTSTNTLSVTCSDGEMESSHLHVYPLLFDLCDDGFGGADIYVITI